MKREEITKALRSNSRRVSVFLCVVALLTCVSVTFAWFGSTFENLNTVITMGDYSSSITVYDTDGTVVESKSASNGEEVGFDSTKQISGWSSGDVAAYYIAVQNTGEIDIKTYFSFKSAFVSQDGTSFDGNRKHFCYLIKNITQDCLKYDGVENYINDNSLLSAEEIHKNGKSFADSGSSVAGRVNSGDQEIYALYFCCYDLPDKFVDSNYSFVLNTSIITTQAGMPEAEVATQPQIGTAPAVIEDATDSSDSYDETQPETTIEATTQTEAESTQGTTTNPLSNSDWTWEYNDSDKETVTITEYKGDAKELIVPSLADGAIVTGLADNLFANSRVEELTVPASVTSFKINTFTCETLKKLTIQSRTLISDEVYESPFVSANGAIYTSDATSLVRYLPQCAEKEFVVPATVRAIYDNAFSGCSELEALSVKNVNSFNANTLSGASITDIKLYNDEPVNAAGFKVFGDTDKVTIHIPEALKEAYKASSATAGYELEADLTSDIYQMYPETELNGIRYMILKSGDEYNGTKYSPDEYSEFVIVTGYTEIPDSGVVNIPDVIVCDSKIYSVAAIADGAFENCTELKTLVLPNHYVEYSSKAFEGCTNLGLIQYNDVLPYTPAIKETAALNDTKTKDDESSDDSE